MEKSFKELEQLQIELIAIINRDLAEKLKLIEEQKNIREKILKELREKSEKAKKIK